VSGTFGPWESVGTAVANASGGWSLKDVDLTAYAGQTVRIGFFHTTDEFTNFVGAGWYIDDVSVVKF
jgi:bacillopeptidase F (M6 metalloprotease family)